MAEKHSAARERAAQHVEEALATGVRGPGREHLQKALKALQGERTSALTTTDYDNLTVAGRLFDPDRPGLLMRHGKRVGKSWIYRYRHPVTDRQTELTIGKYPEVGVADARDVWDRLRGERASGRIPMLTEPEPTIEITMRELVETFISEYASKVKRSWQEDKTNLDRHIVHHYGDLPVSTFTSETVRKILKPIHATAPRQAEKVRAAVHTMFSVAIKGSPKIGTLAGATWLAPDTVNPVTSVTLPKRAAENHKPTRQELQNYVRGLGAFGDRGEALRFQLETFARVNEVAGMSWAEVDLDAAVWRLPAGRAKNGVAHDVMLSCQTVEMLRARKDMSKSRWVFPGAKDQSKAVNVSVLQHVIGKNRIHLGVAEKFTSHSGRHAGLTQLAEWGYSKDLRDRVSNHKPPASADAIYVAATLNEPAREATQRWADHLAGLESRNVVQINEAGA